MNRLRITLPDGQTNTLEIHEDRISIGRLPDNTLQIEDDSVSSHHAEIVPDGAVCQLIDLGSTNGTFVNGEPAGEITLVDGDSVRFGQIEGVFSSAEETVGSQPLPDSGRAEVAIGSASGRPAGFVNASPFPKPSEATSTLSYAAVGLAVLGSLAFCAAVYLTMTMSAPV